MSKKKLDTREQLLKAAGELFYRDGIHATGVDTVVAHSGISKMTLYKYFPSKDELVVAWLTMRCQAWRTWFVAEVEQRGKSPKARLLAIFDALKGWFGSKDFYGCAFINAAAEYSNPSHPIHVAAKAHKRIVQEYVEKLAQESGARKPADLARQLCVLMEGAMATALVQDDPECATTAKTAAQAILDAHGVE